MSEIYKKYLISEEELTERIIEWNRKRNGLELNPVLDIKQNALV